MTGLRPIHGAEHPEGRLKTGLALFGFFCLMVSARWWLIGSYGSPVPFWDQWDAQAVKLFEPYVSGHLTWETLLSPHNEHRILTTRVLALVLFVVNGNWNPVLEMAVNAVLLSGALLMLTGFLAKSLKPGSRAVICVFVVALYAVPYAVENTLAGFQAQFYFNLLFSFLSLWLLVTRSLFSPGWWGGVIASAAAYFSLASGVFVLVAAVAVMALQTASTLLPVPRASPSDRDKTSLHASSSLRVRLAAMVLLSGLFAIGYFFTPQLEAHAGLKAHSMMEFLTALLTESSWPYPVRWRHLVLMNLPVLLFLPMLYWHRAAPVARASWFLLGLVIWVAGQMVALAYGRASTVLAPRYLDLLSIGIVVNFTCLLWCAQALRAGPQRITYLVCLVWACYVAAGFYHERESIGKGVLDKHRYSLAEQSNVSCYLATGDRGCLYDKPYMEIPYPDPVRLQSLLDDPGIRGILPAALLPLSASDRRAGVLDGPLEWVTAHAWLLAMLGVASLAWACMLWKKSRVGPGYRQFIRDVQ